MKPLFCIPPAICQWKEWPASSHAKIVFYTPHIKDGSQWKEYRNTDIFNVLKKCIRKEHKVELQTLLTTYLNPKSRPASEEILHLCGVRGLIMAC
jgi:hypothetical protein